MRSDGGHKPNQVGRSPLRRTGKKAKSSRRVARKCKKVAKEVYAGSNTKTVQNKSKSKHTKRLNEIACRPVVLRAWCMTQDQAGHNGGLQSTYWKVSVLAQRD